METTFQLSKSAAGYSLIEKCYKAVEREDVTGLTQKDFEMAIDYSARALAASSGTEVSKAYNTVLSTPFGKALHSGLYAAKVNASAA